MAKRFAIHPGYVRSSTDGQLHYISGGMLIGLYDLDYRECFIVTGNFGEIVDPELMPLFPLQEGGYKEFLERRKINDFAGYIKARKLYIYHSSGSSLRRATMREMAAARQAKSIAWHEKHWPDFRAAYDKHYGDKT